LAGSSLVSGLKKIKADKYDAIIAVCACHDAIEAVLKYKEKVHCETKAILIQFDPFAENFSLQKCGRANLEQHERRIYEKCDFIYSAPFILRGKSEDWISKKVRPSELPAIVKKKMNQRYRPLTEKSSVSMRET
jgi:hypothetical protein